MLREKSSHRIKLINKGNLKRFADILQQYGVTLASTKLIIFEIYLKKSTQNKISK